MPRVPTRAWVALVLAITSGGFFFWMGFSESRVVYFMIGVSVLVGGVLGAVEQIRDHRSGGSTGRKSKQKEP